MKKELYNYCDNTMSKQFQVEDNKWAEGTIHSKIIYRELYGVKFTNEIYNNNNKLDFDIQVNSKDIGIENDSSIVLDFITKFQNTVGYKPNHFTEFISRDKYLQMRHTFNYPATIEECIRLIEDYSETFISDLCLTLSTHY